MLDTHLNYVNNIIGIPNMKTYILFLFKRKVSQNLKQNPSIFPKPIEKVIEKIQYFLAISKLANSENHLDSKRVAVPRLENIGSASNKRYGCRIVDDRYKKLCDRFG